MNSGCSDFDSESFSFLFADAPLPTRLWREIRQAGTSLSNDPAGFLQALLRGDGLTRQRLDLLQSGVALAVAAYAVIFVFLTLLGLRAPVQAVSVADTPALPALCENCEITRLALVKPVKANVGTAHAAGVAAGGSSPVKRDAHGGGGSGQQQPRPAQFGVLPPMVSHPPMVLANLNQPNFVPSLPVLPTIEGDPEAIIRMKGRVGDPTGERDTNSNGPGTGGAMGNGNGPGIGDGNGSGALKGQNGNIGNGTRSIGCCVPGGSGGSGEPLYTSRVVITHREKAQYTELARQNRVMGIVVLNALFGADGQISDIRVVRQLPDGLTEEAIRAMRKMRFRPATKNGQPVAVRMSIEFSFNIF